MTEQQETPEVEADDAQEPTDRQPLEFLAGGFGFTAEWSEDPK